MMSEEMISVRKSDLRSYRKVAIARINELHLKRDLMARDKAELDEIVQRIDELLAPDFPAIQEQIDNGDD